MVGSVKAGRIAPQARLKRLQRSQGWQIWEPSHGWQWLHSCTSGAVARWHGRAIVKISRQAYDYKFQYFLIKIDKKTLQCPL
ncbi:hypothetical protein [Microcoleus sp. herbarium5]|uniref:hypothetical protein n=1 Tax=Microcoleus sp. herbarium5 TaxID=3055434 RepID=UPI002FD540C7